MAKKKKKNIFEQLFSLAKKKNVSQNEVLNTFAGAINNIASPMFKGATTRKGKVSKKGSGGSGRSGGYKYQRIGGKHGYQAVKNNSDYKNRFTQQTHRNRVKAGKSAADEIKNKANQRKYTGRNSRKTRGGSNNGIDMTARYKTDKRGLVSFGDRKNQLQETKGYKDYKKAKAKERDKNMWRPARTIQGALKQFAASEGEAIGRVADASNEEANWARQQEAANNANLARKGEDIYGRRLSKKGKRDYKKAAEYFKEAAERTEKARKQREQVMRKLNQSGTKDIEKAKEGLGGFGQFMVDALAAGTQFGADTLVSGGAGTMRMIIMGARSYTGGVMQAKDEMEKQILSAKKGKNPKLTAAERKMIDDKAELYGALSAAREVGTEKIFNVGYMNKLMGNSFLGGKASAALEKAASKAATKLAKTKAGRSALYNGIISGQMMLTEGVEEFIADVVDVPMQRATYNSNAQFDLKEAVKDFAIGGILGGLGVGGQISQARSDSKVIQTEQERKKTGRKVKRGNNASPQSARVNNESPVQKMINSGLAQSEKTASYQMARQIQDQIDAGQGIIPGQLSAMQNHLATNQRETQQKMTAARRQAIKTYDEDVKAGRIQKTFRSKIANKDATVQEYKQAMQRRGTLQEPSEAEEKKYSFTPELAAASSEAGNYIMMKDRTANVMNTLGLRDEEAKNIVTNVVTGYITDSRDLDSFSPNGGTEAQVMRAAFQELTGKELPDTVEGTQEVIMDHVAQQAYQNGENNEVASKIYDMCVAVQGVAEELGDEAGHTLEEQMINDDIPIDEILQYADAFRSYYTGGGLGLSYEQQNDTAAHYAKQFAGSAMPQVAFAAGSAVHFNEETERAVREKRKEKSEKKKEKKKAKKKGTFTDKTTDDTISKKDKKILKGLAEKIGVDIVLEDTLASGSANGYYTGGVIYIAADAEDPLITVFKHELTHHLQKTAPEEYKALRDFVRDKWYQGSDEALNKAIQAKIRAYRGAKEGGITPDEALDEILADAAEAFFRDDAVINEVIRANRSLGEKILEWIRSIIADIKAMMAEMTKGDSEFKDTTKELADLGILEEAEKLWTKALAASVQSDVDVEGGETRFSVYSSFYEKFDDFIENNTPEQRLKAGGFIEVGTVSDVLKSIGARGEKVRIGKSKIQKIMDDHPEMSDKIIRQVPELLENPVVVLQSKTRFDSIVILGELIAENGEPVMASVKLGTDTANGIITEFEVITSAYSRTRENIQGLLKESRILYVDPNKKRTENWLSSLRVQFPSEVTTFGSIANITYSDELGNSEEEKNKKSSMQLAFEKAQDQKYLKAVKAGDMETAQKMVDEAAKAAGYDTSEKLYHGTGADFNVFKSGGGQYGNGVYFTYDESVAKMYGRKNAGDGRIITVYTKPLHTADYTDLGEVLGIESLQSYWDEVDEGYIEDDITNLEGHPESIDALTAAGYDSFYDEGNNGVVIFDINGGIDSMVKSADPVTYDDQGNVIPLSERFNEEKEDVRYSMRQQKAVNELNEKYPNVRFSLPMPGDNVGAKNTGVDSSGRELSDGMKEFMADSFATDRDGNLANVFHTTNRGGFTVFDPKKSDDKISLFFASNFGVSQTYGYDANRPFNFDKERPEFKTFTDFERMVRTTYQLAYGETMVSTFNIRVRHKTTDGIAYELGRRATERFDAWLEMAEAGKDTSEYMIDMEDPGWVVGKKQSSEGIYVGSLSELLQNLEEAMNVSSTGSKPGKMSGYYECYLNLKNPLIIEGNYANWHSIWYDPTGETTDDFLTAVEKISEKSSVIVRRIDTDFEFDDDGWPTGKVQLDVEYEKKNESGEWVPGSIHEEHVVQSEDEDPILPLNLWINGKLKDLGMSYETIDDIWMTMDDFNGEVHFKAQGSKDSVYVDANGERLKFDDIYAPKSHRYKTRQLAKYAKDMGFDGVIIRDIRDLGGTSNYKGNPVKAFSDIYIAFDSNQVKSIYNENPTEDDDIRFSLKEPVEETRDLVAMHNLWESDLAGIMELGGIPMPSIAVTNQEHTSFGDITLLFDKSTIDPARKYNEIYGGDAWTPTFPEIQQKISDSVARRVDDKIKNLLGLEWNAREVARGLTLPAFDTDNIGNALRSFTPYEAYRNSLAMRVAFIKDTTGTKVRIPMQEAKLNGHEESYWKWISERMPELTMDDAFGSVDEVMAYEPELRKVLRGFIEHKYSGSGAKRKLRDLLLRRYDEPLGYADVQNTLVYLVQYREEGMPAEVDRDKLREKLDKRISEKKYKQWIETLFDGIVEKEGLRNDRDMFTPAGNRRSWESLHDPVTLENIVKRMRQELSQGVGIFGGNPRGAAQKKYGSLDEVRADKGRLRMLDDEEYKDFEEKAMEKMHEVCDDIADHNRGSRSLNAYFGAVDVGTYVSEVLNRTRSRVGIKRILENEYNITTTERQMDDLMDAIASIAEIPTGYFEAKPRRAVGLDEIKAVIIPNTGVDQEIIDKLRALRIPLYAYYPDWEGNRQEMVNRAAEEQNVRFSLKDSDGNTLSEGQQEYFRDSRARDENGNLLVLYHGTPKKGFTVFKDWQYFTANKGYATNYADQNEDNLYKVYANVKKPFDTRIPECREIFENEYLGNYSNTPLQESGLPDWTDGYDLTEFLEENGYDYDAVLLDEGATPSENGEVQERGISYVVRSSNQVKNTDNKTPTEDPDIRFSFAGENALNANNVMLDAAKKMESEGKDSEEIRQTTGWFKSYDGKWRFEIDDSKATVDTDVNHWRRFTNIPGTLDDVLDHPVLFANYPQLRKINIRYGGSGKSGSTETFGSFNHTTKTLTLYFGTFREGKAQGSIIHEIQHNIQELEGFSEGAMPSRMKGVSIPGKTIDEFRATALMVMSVAEREYNITIDHDNFTFEDLDNLLPTLMMNAVQKADYESLEKVNIYTDARAAYEEAYEKTNYGRYQRVAGEVEARDVEARLGYSEETRRKTRPDIDRNDVILGADIKYSLKNQEEERAIRRALDNQEKTIDKLREKVADLRSEFRRTRVATIDDKVMTKDLKAYLKEWGSNAKTEDVLNAVRSIHKDLLNREAADWEHAYATAEAAAKDIINHVTILHDEMYQQYEGLRKYLRETRLALSPKDRTEIPDYEAFRKSNMGKIKLVNKGRPVDTVYGELTDLYPEFFNEDSVNTPGEMVMQMVDVLDSLKPHYETLDSDAEQDAVAEVAQNLIEFAYDPKLRKTFADRAAERQKAAVEKEKEKGKQRRQADKERFQEKINKIKAERKQAIEDLKLTEKQRREKLLKKQGEKIKQIKVKAKERSTRKKNMDSIKRNAEYLSQALLKPTEAKHIPQAYRAAVAKLLGSLDFESVHTDAWIKKYGQPSARVQGLREMADAYREIQRSGEYEHLEDPYFELLVDSLAEHAQGMRLADMDNAQLADMATIVKALRHNISNINRAFNDNIRETIAELGDKSIEELEKHKKAGNFGGAAGLINKWLNESSVNPGDFFETIGSDTINKIYMEIRKGFDQHVLNMDEAKGRLHSIVNKKQAAAWSEKAKTEKFDLSNGQTVEITPAQKMTLWCLMQRDQAKQHILGQGIVLDSVLRKERNVIKRAIFGNKTRQQDGTLISFQDVYQIISTLTPEQRQVCQGIMDLMNGMCKDWGNEASMKLYGYEKFAEENYFPIQSAEDWLNTNSQQENVIPKIKNQGMTKATSDDANNPIVVGDIFNIVAKHVNDMSMYSTLAVPLTDFERVYNYKQRNDAGGQTGKTTKSVITAYAGVSAKRYINQWLKDVNNYRENDTEVISKISNKLLANYKKATIGFNLRVLIQQPTALVRSMILLSPRDVAKVLVQKPAVATIKEMIEHSPLARWKSDGHFETDISRTLRDDLMGKRYLLDRITMDPYGFADNLAWASMWKAVKNEIHRTRPELQKGSEEYWQAVNERFEYVMDRTQVVDSMFHRSQVMRNQNIAVKMITSFMAEPTKTFNMLRTECVKAARQWQAGNKKEAAGTFARAGSVFLINAAAVSAAAAVIDLIRDAWDGDDDDDDKEQSKWDKFFTYLKNNFAGNANPLAMLVGGNTIFNALEGFDTENLSTKAIGDMIGMIEKWEKFIDGDSKFSLMGMIKQTITPLGQLIGVPLKNFEREFETVYRAVIGASAGWNVADYMRAKNFQLNPKSDKAAADFMKIWKKAINNGDEKGAQIIREDMIKEGIADPDKFEDKLWEMYGANLESDVMKGKDVRKTINQLKAAGVDAGDINDKMYKYLGKRLDKEIEARNADAMRSTIWEMQTSYGADDEKIKNRIKYTVREQYYDAFNSDDTKTLDELDGMLRVAGETDLKHYRYSYARARAKMETYNAGRSGGESAAYRTAYKWLNQYPGIYKNVHTMMYGIERSGDSTKADWRKGKYSVYTSWDWPK